MTIACKIHTYSAPGERQFPRKELASFLIMFNTVVVASDPLIIDRLPANFETPNIEVKEMQAGVFRIEIRHRVYRKQVQAFKDHV